MNKTRLASGTLMLLLSLSLALPVEAHGPQQNRQAQGAQGVPQQGAQFRGAPAGNFANQGERFVPQQGAERRGDFRFDQRAVGPRVDLRGRGDAQVFDYRRGVPTGQWPAGRQDGRGREVAPWRTGDNGVPAWLGNRHGRQPGFDGRDGREGNRGNLGRWNPVPYRGDERGFRAPGFIDPGSRIRGGNGFYRYGDDRFFNSQFENRWGRGFYGRTHGDWERHRVGGRWPWNPIGIGVGIGFYNGWGYNGIEIGFGNSGYYALDGFCPTEYIFTVSEGRFWRPGGAVWYQQLPQSYDAPITVAVREVVPVTDEDGYVVDYESHIFYYNAFLDPSTGYYGYYDYSGSFHWVN